MKACFVTVRFKKDSIKRAAVTSASPRLRRNVAPSLAQVWPPLERPRGPGAAAQSAAGASTLEPHPLAP